MKPPDQVKRKLVEQWFNKAEEDYQLVEYLISSEGAYHAAICFHAQQAAEKYLKAVLVRDQTEFPKTHDIEQLLDLINTTQSSPASSLREATLLSIYGVEVRYPGDFPAVTPEDAKKAMKLAAMVREAVETLLKGYLK